MIGGATLVAIGAGVAIALRQQPSTQVTASPSPQLTAASPVSTSPLSTTASVAPSPAASPAAASSASVPSPAATSKPAAPQPERTSSGTTATSPQVLRCVVSMARVNDPNPPLNVRAKPEITSDNVVGNLPNGSFVDVVSQQEGWLQINNPLNGWIAQDRAEFDCNQKTVRINFAPNTTATTINGKFIGTGVHQYLIKAQAGQTMTITLTNGSFPALYAPGNRSLIDDPNRDSRTQWSGKLPATGEYTLELDSNFRGYPYSFKVAVE